MNEGEVRHQCAAARRAKAYYWLQTGRLSVAPYSAFRSWWLWTPTEGRSDCTVCRYCHQPLDGPADLFAFAGVTVADVVG